MIIAIVVQVTGQAWARDAEGNLRPLAEGDRLTEGEVVITETGARVNLVQPDGTRLAQLGGEVEPALVIVEGHHPNTGKGEELRRQLAHKTQA